MILDKQRCTPKCTSSEPEVDTNLPAVRVIRVLDRIAAWRGYPDKVTHGQRPRAGQCSPGRMGGRPYRLESIWSRVLLRIKKIGRRWSPQRALRMLTATFVQTLHPRRYRELEAQIRGDKLPHVSMLITTLKPEWIA